MGGKTATTTSQVKIPKEVLARYNKANRMADKAASRPFQKYKGDFVADVNAQQQEGISTINNATNAADPYFQQAQEYLQKGAGTATPGELDINRYMSPYMNEVVDSTAALIDQGNEQAMSGSLGDAIKSGGFGGDRAGVAAAVLAGQQQMSRANTLAGLKQQGYQQAVGTAQQQQGVDLAARQADLARYLQSAQESAGLGTASQQAGLAGGEAQINAGTLLQQTKQAEKTAKYQQFLQKRGHPFQIAQFLANIAMGTGSLSGSTTTTEQPAPFFSDRRLKRDIKRIGKTDDGLPIYTYKYKGDDTQETHIGFMADEVEKKHPEAVGVAGGFKTVDYEKATEKADGGGVAGPYGSMVGSDPYESGYVPEDWLKVGQLMRPDTSGISRPSSAWDEVQSLTNFGKQLVGMKDTASEISGWFDKKADGGGVGAAYLSSKPDIPEPDDTLGNVIDQQEKDNQKAHELQAASTPSAPPSGASQLGSAAGGIGSLLSGIAGIFALSDSRAKTDIKRIGWTDDGKLPIYSFKYKGDDKAQTHIGPMAQDVEKVRPDAVREFGGMKHVDYEKATEKSYGGIAGYADGGVPMIVEDVPAGVSPEDAIYGKVVETKPEGVAPSIIAKPKEEVKVPALETIEVKERPNIVDARIVDEPALRSVDTPTGIKPIPKKDNRLAYRNAITDIESGGNYNAIGPLTKRGDRAYGRYQVMGENIPQWTQEVFGKPMSVKEFLSNPEAQDAVFDHRFQSYVDKYGSPQEAASVWFTGRPISEGGNRKDVLGTTGNQYVDKFTSGLRKYAGVAEDTVKDAAEGARDLSSGVLSGIKNVANETGDFVSDTGSGVKDFLSRNKGNQDLILSILSGLGTMASSPSRYLGAAVLQGIGGGAKTYADLQKQSADIRATDTASRAQAINSVFDSIKPVDGVNHIIDENGNLVKFWDAVRNPEFRGIGGKMLDETVKKMAIDAYRQGKDPNKIKFGETIQTAPVEAAKVEGAPDNQAPANTVTDEGGKIIQSAVPIEEPTGVRWRDASKDAISENQKLLSQQPTMRIPLLEQTQKDVSAAAERAKASIEALPQITEQAAIVTDAIADRNMGSIGTWYADNVVKPYNTLARSLGWGEVTGPPNADTQRIMLNKLSTLNAQNLKPEDQSSYQALSDFMEVSPNLDMTPEAASLITAQQMGRNQRAIDRANYMTTVLQQSPTGEGVWTQNNEKAFNAEMGDLYLTEQENISNLMRLAEKDGRVRKFMHEAKSGAFTGEEGAKKAQAILDRLLGEKASPILYRYFQRG